MIYILLSVLFNTLLFIILKLFTRFKINNFQAIVVNYFTAFLMGLLLSNQDFTYSEIITKSWYPGSFMLGFLFISVFYVMALTSQQNGISVASVASKMSVIIPVCFGVILYNESMGFMKISGVILALAAVYFSSKKESTSSTEYKNMLLPILLFFGAGAIDTSLKVMQNDYMQTEEIAQFSANTFLTAFTIGLCLITYKLLKKKIAISRKNILAGIILGIPNYFSLYFLIKMLDSPVFESSTIFTIHNVGIVMLSTLIGILFFNEKLTLRNGFGILLALIAIFLVTN